MSLFSLSGVLSFRTLRIEISNFFTNNLTAVLTLSIDMNLSSFYKVTSVRIFGTDVPLFFIRNVTCLCGLRIATSHFPSET